MKARTLFILSILAVSFNAAALTQFKPAVLNAALLFDHNPSTGNVKHSLQSIRDEQGKLQVMTEVKYDRSGCFTNINMVDRVNGRIFHVINKDGVLSSFKGQPITGKVNKHCEITELENEQGKYTFIYNVHGLLEKAVDRDTGKVATLYEYRNSQFPERIRDYNEPRDDRFFIHQEARNSLTRSWYQKVRA
ncbi:lipoprotein [Cedecea lapagei]|uniref:Lipoprotein n=1 Tax=Cedecea lapagei TaxID=158823 RepID=A0A3S5DPK4_9ENTR|nr:YnfC family lipoprotein [Cedecea lapagei]VEB96083.1 lipoprotein [Cedecea lapagei]